MKQEKTLKREMTACGSHCGKRRRAWVGALLLATVLANASRSAWAASDEWVHSSGSLSWFASTNWSLGVPTTGDDAYIGNGTTAFVEGTTVATAASLSVDSGGVTIGSIDPGTLDVTGQLAVGTVGSSGSLTLDYGTVSLNTLAVGTAGTYADTTYGTLNLTGADPTIKMANGVTVLVNSQITGSNGLVKAGVGTLTLANNNAYSGGTTISVGTLQVGNGGTTGTVGEGQVVNNGALVFNRSDSLTVSNLISGTGSLKQSGSGTLILTSDNTYNGGTAISSGTLHVGDGGTAGSLGTGNVTNNAALLFNRSDAVEVANVISGSGTVAQTGSGTVILTGENTYSGITTVTNGTLQVGNGGTTGSLGSGNVSNHGALIFNRTDEVSVGNLISGTGAVTQAGSGRLTLTANNTYSGITTINSGILQIGDGGASGSLGTNEVHNFGTLAFNRSNSITVDNLISGTGSLAHTGTGELTLTATNTYSGGTSVENGGTLLLQNALALGSGDLRLVNGVLRAGDSLTEGLSMQVAGNYTQEADGTLELGIGGTSITNFDQLKITGTAALNGTLRLVQANDYTPHHNDELKLVVADGGVSGEFATFTNEIAHSPLLDPELAYNPTDVTLTWEHLSFLDYLVASNNVGLTANQRAIGQAMDSILNSSSSNLVALVDHLDYLDDLTNSLPAAFDDIAPEELTSLMVASLANLQGQGQQFLKRAAELRADYRHFYTSALSQRTRSPDVLAAYVNRPSSVYVDVPIGFVGVDGDANADGYDLTSYGLTVGLDRQLSEHWIIGGALGYANSGADLSNGGDLDLTAFNGQLYATWFQGGLHLEGMAGGAFNSFDTKRQAIEGMADGSTDGFGWTALLGGGYDWEKGPWKIGPQASFQYLAASIDEFTESGSLSPLRIGSQTEDSLQSQLGINIRYRLLVPDSWTVITPQAYLAWRHDFTGNDLSLDAQFAGGEGSSFTVRGAELGGDSAVVALGVSIQWKPAFNTYIHFTSSLGGSGYDSQQLNLGARLSF